MILGLALCGAFGMALIKETRFFNIEIQRIGNQHIIERINNSSYLTEVRKKEYIRWVKEQPFIAMNTFIDFLNEEENKKKRF
jgi:nucleoid-associated protein YejK